MPNYTGVTTQLVDPIVNGRLYNMEGLLETYKKLLEETCTPFVGHSATEFPRIEMELESERVQAQRERLAIRWRHIRTDPIAFAKAFLDVDTDEKPKGRLIMEIKND